MTNDMTLISIIDEWKIYKVMTQYAHAYDTRNWKLLKSIFTENAILDYVDAGGIRGNLDEIIIFMQNYFGDEYHNGLFSFSQHLLGNFDIQFVGTLHAYTRVMFYNPMGLRMWPIQPSFYVGGWYNINMTKVNESWKISHLTQDIAYNTLTRDIGSWLVLFALAFWYISFRLVNYKRKSKRD